MFIVKESVQREFLVKSQTFFAIPVKLDPVVERLVLKVQDDAQAVESYLTRVRTALSTRAAPDLSSIGVPSCLEEPELHVADYEYKPAKKVTEATSKKKSQKGSKKTEQKASDTSQQKDE